MKQLGFTINVSGKLVLQIAQEKAHLLKTSYDEEVLFAAGLGTTKKLNAFAKELAKDPQFRKHLSVYLSDKLKQISTLDILSHKAPKVKLYDRKIAQLQQLEIELEDELSQQRKEEENYELLDDIDLLNSKGYDVVLK